MDIIYKDYKDEGIEIRTPIRLRQRTGGVRCFRGALRRGNVKMMFLSVRTDVSDNVRAAAVRTISTAPTKSSWAGLDREIVLRGKCLLGEGGLAMVLTGHNTTNGIRNHDWYGTSVIQRCPVIWRLACTGIGPGGMDLDEFLEMGRTIMESLRITPAPAAEAEPKPKPPEAKEEQSDEVPGRNMFDSEAVDNVFRMASRMTGKKSRAQAVPSAEDILGQLDQCAAAFNFPILDNGYVYLADVRLSAYRDKKRWAMIIETLGYNPRASGMQSFSSSLYCFGNCLKGKPGLDNDSWVYPISDGPDGPLLDEANSLNEGAKSLRIRETVVRINRDAAFLAGKKIGWKFDIENWRAYALRQKEPVRKNLLDAAQRMAESPGDAEFAGQDLLRSLLPEYRAKLLATDGELAKRLKAKVPLVLRLEEWHHPDVTAGESPGRSEVFQMVAEVLATGDVQRYKPTQEPNTHWRNWPSGGDL